LWLQEPGREAQVADGRELVRLSGQQSTLHLAVDGLSEEQIASAMWQLADADARPMRQTTPQEWTASLSEVPWARRSYTLRVVLRTREAEPREFSKEVSIRFAPHHL